LDVLTPDDVSMIMETEDEVSYYWSPLISNKSATFDNVYTAGIT